MSTITKEDLGLEIYLLCDAMSSAEVILELKKRYEKLCLNNDWVDLIVKYKRTRSKLELTASTLLDIINKVKELEFRVVNDFDYREALTKYMNFGPNTFPTNTWFPLFSGTIPFDSTIDSVMKNAFYSVSTDNYDINKPVNAYIETEEINYITWVRCITFYQVRGI